MKEDNLILDILEGVSSLEVSGETLFFAHPTIKQKLRDTKIHQECEKRGKENNILSEEELIENAIKRFVDSR